VTIPALLILKNLDDDDKGICKLFYPPMFGEVDANTSEKNPKKDPIKTDCIKFSELRKDYNDFRITSKNAYDYYNIIEKSVLEMEGEESTRISEEILRENGMNRDDLYKIV